MYHNTNTRFCVCFPRKQEENLFKGKAKMESGKGVIDKKGINTNDVVVLQISDSEDAFLGKSSQKNSNNEGTELENLRCRVQASTTTSSSSPEILTSTPTTNKPPKFPTEQVLTRRKSLATSAFSKPKSRLVEPHNANDAKLVGEKTQSSQPHSTSPSGAATTPKEKLKSGPITPKTPLIGSPKFEGEEDEDDEEVYQTENLKVSENQFKKMKVLVIIEWIAFVLLMGLLISSLTVNKLQNYMIWGLELWKWCVLVSVIFCGRLFTGWFINVLVFSIERNYLLKKKVLYFVYGLRGSVRVFVWLALVLLAWDLLINRGVKRSKETSETLKNITRALAFSYWVCFMVGEDFLS
ncbi:hypothetical protein LWI29_026323 [Acer saccharum]|uniref:Uncharacterized protein n=1 Tax=Acer saccharum TaxID=4024 RepID=A0AA39UKT7_ACESA|nr:hypothetical protein LWI29_026323 [Acer saccharum]